MEYGFTQNVELNIDSISLMKIGQPDTLSFGSIINELREMPIDSTYTGYSQLLGDSLEGQAVYDEELTKKLVFSTGHGLTLISDNEISYFSTITLDEADKYTLLLCNTIALAVGDNYESKTNEIKSYFTDHLILEDPDRATGPLLTVPFSKASGSGAKKIYYDEYLTIRSKKGVEDIISIRIWMY